MICIEIIEYKDLSNSPLIPGAIYKAGEKGGFTSDPLPRLFKIDGFNKGIGNQSGIRKSNKERNGKSISETAFVVIKDTRKQEVWPNKYNEETKILTYYGDNRTIDNHYMKTKQKGNMVLESVFKKSYINARSRKTIPPMFFFQSINSSGDLRFIGLAVPGVFDNSYDEVLRRIVFTVEEGNFENLIAEFTILDSEIISREWLAELKEANISEENNAPEKWTEFIELGVDILYPTERFRYPEYNDLRDHERKYVRDVRITQHLFRKSLLFKHQKCQICKLGITELLVASHIKPWRICEGDEKINVDNGLLLCPNHDSLFDKGYITFDKSGMILISKSLDIETQKSLNIDMNIKLNMSQGNADFMEWHRENLFIK